jgi:urease accessory protein
MIRGLPMRRILGALPVTIAAALAAAPAWAHHFMDNALPGTFVEGLLSGLGHPLIGVDHAAFIVATGFFLARIKGGMWGVAALIAGSLFGAALHLNGIDIVGGEIGVALSVIVAGGLLMGRWRIELAWLTGGLALAGALHGHAYAEAIFGAEATPLGAYLVGFSLMQLGVAAAAFFAHRRLIAVREAWAGPFSAGLGAATGAVGVVFLAINIAG